MEWKDVYIFISSTFNDMFAERDYLIKRVIPELSQRCEKYKLHVKDIDLRWGITYKDATENKKTVEICLKNVAFCKPFFLCFLGQRRGWVPKKDDVNLSELDGIDSQILLKHLSRNESITEMEVNQAVLDKIISSADKNAFFYFRQDAYLHSLPSHFLPIYTNKINLDNEYELTQDKLLLDFKQKIKAKFDVTSYSASWNCKQLTPEFAYLNQGGLDYTQGRLDSFKVEEIPLCQIIIDQLWNAIVDSYQLDTVSNAENEADELSIQDNFLYENSQTYIKRQDIESQIDAFFDSDNKLLAVIGQAGQGKTTLLANYIINNKVKHNIYYRFLGISSNSSTIESVLTSLIKQIFPNSYKDEMFELNEIIDYFAKLLNGESNITLVFDGLDQISQNFAQWKYVFSKLNVKIIYSFKLNEQTEEFFESLNSNIITINQLNKNQTILLINNYLNQYLKSLDHNFIEQIVNSQNVNPLFLKVALNELRQYGSYQILKDKFYELGDTISSCFTSMLNRLENDANYCDIPFNVAVPLFFGLLSASRNGLSIKEMSQAMKLNLDQYSILQIEDTINYIVRQCRGFITNRITINFFYHSFKLVCISRYSVNFSLYHNLLFKVFNSFADVDGNSTYKGKDANAFNELTYHLLCLNSRTKQCQAIPYQSLLTNYYFVTNKMRLCGLAKVFNDFNNFLYDNTPTDKQGYSQKIEELANARIFRLNQRLSQTKQSLVYIRKALTSSLDLFKSDISAFNNYIASYLIGACELNQKSNFSPYQDMEINLFYLPRVKQQLLIGGEFLPIYQFLNSMFLANSNLTIDLEAYFNCLIVDAVFNLDCDWDGNADAVSFIDDKLYYANIQGELCVIDIDHNKVKFDYPAKLLALENDGHNLLSAFDDGSFTAIFLDKVKKLFTTDIKIVKIYQFNGFVFLQLENNNVLVYYNQRPIDCINGICGEIRNIQMDSLGNSQQDGNLVMLVDNLNSIFLYSLDSKQMLVAYKTNEILVNRNKERYWCFYKQKCFYICDDNAITILDLVDGSKTVSSIENDGEIYTQGDKLLLSKNGEIFYNDIKIKNAVAPLLKINEYKGNLWFIDSSNKLYLLRSC
ncbi:MAG: DUF4062 domain-containing protein [Clostridia bacterium]